jgi:3-oxoacyl-[acyl-carrier protein] reductase
MNYLVIGGSKGIGAEICSQLSNEGHSVIMLARSEGNSSTIPGLSYYAFDAVEPDFSDIHLPNEIHGLVYCPGSINLKPFHRLSENDFEADYRLHVLGAIKSIQFALPQLKNAQGSIVLFSTVAVQTGMPFHASIAMAKGAVEGLTRSLAAEYAPLIRVNCIAPSLTDTPLTEKLLASPEKREAAGKRHPLGRVGSPRDLASMATFLLGEHATWISGQIIGVDGGIGKLKTM